MCPVRQACRWREAPGATACKTGDLQKNQTTDDRTPTISGTGQVGAVVTVSVDGTAVGSTTVASDGTWSVT
ncbi:Ig-like domain-containing protein, partial [Acinetobacter soli]